MQQHFPALEKEFCLVLELRLRLRTKYSYPKVYIYSCTNIASKNFKISLNRSNFLILNRDVNVCRCICVRGREEHTQKYREREVAIWKFWMVTVFIFLLKKNPLIVTDKLLTVLQTPQPSSVIRVCMQYHPHTLLQNFRNMPLHNKNFKKFTKLLLQIRILLRS